MEIITNAANVSKLIQSIDTEIRTHKYDLFKTLGPLFVRDVENRIATQDNGRWAQASKWTLAKRGDMHKILSGLEDVVKWKAYGGKLVIYGDTGNPAWTLTQHHQGFESHERSGEEVDGRITIDIVNPGPLSLGKTGTFSWTPGRTGGHVPARKIWPDDSDARVIVLPIASRWLQAMVVRALKGGVLGTVA